MAKRRVRARKVFQPRGLTRGALECVWGAILKAHGAGDFLNLAEMMGPIMIATTIEFQKRMNTRTAPSGKKLREDGVVDTATWRYATLMLMQDIPILTDYVYVAPVGHPNAVA